MRRYDSATEAACADALSLASRAAFDRRDRPARVKGAGALICAFFFCRRPFFGIDGVGDEDGVAAAGGSCRHMDAFADPGDVGSQERNYPD